MANYIQRLSVNQLKLFKPANLHPGCWSLIRNCTSQESSSTKPKPSAPISSIPDVPGLSSAVVAAATGEVGPGASKTGDYKNPEYFLYNNMSYFEAEIEMAKYRLPQPSSKKK
ncbi:uncharacterized protein [Anabrus simplex]|uniref:uncharacterized protein n=1 Tax=Anabrus simplex TaxID=316456 RepID=UPI0035A342DC